MAFRALLSDKDSSGGVQSRVTRFSEEQLPPGEVLVAVEWSGLNFKDALCLGGLGNLVKTFPHVAGIDLAGRVVESQDPRYQPGQAVVLTGWRVGETHWGGYAERARVRADWLVPLTEKLSTRAAMMLGTAGITAMLAIDRLEREGMSPADGEVLVTGAGGGVGSLAVMLLSRLGYRTVAVTGRSAMAEQLLRLGATSVVDRTALLEPSGRALDKEQWIAAIDPVGGPLLGEVLKKIRYGGAVATIGAAGGATWEASVIPFILRGVSLLGIDSVMQPYQTRVVSWDRLGELFDPAAYEPWVRQAHLEDLPQLAKDMLKGAVAGRVVVAPDDVA